MNQLAQKESLFSLGAKVGLAAIIVWYWLPHLTTEQNDSEPAQSAGAIIVPPIAMEVPAVEQETVQSPEVTEPEAEPSKEVAESPEVIEPEVEPSKEVAESSEVTEPEAEPSNEVAESPEVIEPEVEPSNEVAELPETFEPEIEPQEEIASEMPIHPDSESVLPEPTADAVEDPSAPPAGESSIRSGGKAIAGRAVDIRGFIDWLREQGGTLWLDDGELELGRLYEVDASYDLIPVSRQSYKRAQASYIPRQLSPQNHYRVARIIPLNRGERLMFLWPRAVWMEIQEHADALQAEQVQMEYRIVAGQLQVYVVAARREGALVPELTGPLL